MCTAHIVAIFNHFLTIKIMHLNPLKGQLGAFKMASADPHVRKHSMLTNLISLRHLKLSNFSTN